MNIRKSLAEALDPSKKVKGGLSKTNAIIVGLICLSILIGIAETETALTDGFEYLYNFANWFFFVIFFLEYIARIYAAPENPKYKSSFKYMLTMSSVLDLSVLISFVIPVFGLEASILRVFRAGKIIRLANFGRYSIAVQIIHEAILQRRYELVVSVIIAICLMLLSSTALYFSEKALQPEAFGSIPRAMWWSIATLTTVGYGDVVPLTVLGRIAAALTAITGIGIIALPTGILAGAFSDGIQKIKEKK